MTTIDRRYSVAEGTAVKAPCRVATTANITLSGLQTIDGITVVEHDRVLVKNQSTASQNGIYEASSGNWLRAKDFDGSYDVVEGTRVFVTDGSLGAGIEYTVDTANPITIDTTSISFVSLMANAVTAAAASASAAAASQSAASSSASAASSSASAASSSASAASASAVAAAASAASAVPVLGVYKNLSIKVATVSTVTVAADFVVLSDGTNYKTLAISGTIDFGNNGAVNRLDSGSAASATWYAIWAIAKSDGTQGCLASLSGTSPTLPSGYTFKARLGWVRTAAASSDLLGTWQYGRRVQYIVGLAGTSALPIIVSTAGATGTYSATGPTWSAQSVATLVPSTASEIFVTWSANRRNAGAGTNIQIAPNNSYGGYANTSDNIPPYDNGASGASGGSLHMVLESTSIYVAFNQNATVSVSGWIDNI